MKKLISSLLVFVFMMTIAIVPVPSASVDDAEIGASAELAETGAISPERQKVVDYMMDMATVEWKCGKNSSAAIGIFFTQIKHIMGFLMIKLQSGTLLAIVLI